VSNSSFFPPPSETAFSTAPPLSPERQAVLDLLDAALKAGTLDERAHREASRVLAHYYLNSMAEADRNRERPPVRGGV
jgi:hypothetical protein